MPFWRLSNLYFFYFALLGAILPYWNLYLSASGYSAIEIGYLGAILMGSKAISPYFLGWLTDKTARPVTVIRWSNFIALILFSCIFWGDDAAGKHHFIYLASIIAGFSFFWNAVIGQYEALTLMHLGQQFRRYGPIRAWGSIGFIVAVTGLGYLFESLNVLYLPHIMAVLLFMIWLSSLFIKDIPVSQSTTEAPASPHFSIIHILKRRDVFAFFLGCFLVKFAHGPYYTFFSIYLDAFGYSKTVIGLLWAIGVIAELFLFFIMARILDHFSLRTILIFSVVVGVFRWVVIGSFPNSLPLLIIAQITHAATFASYHAAAVEWVRSKFGRRYQGQGQALYSATSFGAGSALGALVSGWLWTDTLSINWTYTWLLASVVSFIAIFVFRYGLDLTEETTVSKMKIKK